MINTIMKFLECLRPVERILEAFYRIIEGGQKFVHRFAMQRKLDEIEANEMEIKVIKSREKLERFKNGREKRVRRLTQKNVSQRKKRHEPVIKKLPESQSVDNALMPTA